MIDFENNSVHALCHPGRGTNIYASRLEDEVMDIFEDQALAADDKISNKEYDEAIEILSSMIERLEDLEDVIKSDNADKYSEIYEEVANTGYHGRIVRASQEHDELPCVLGALKASKTDLEEQPF